MPRVAFLGLGAMGRRMALRLLDRGHELVVWSRSGVPAEVPALRACAVGSPAEAAAQAELVIAMVRDDAASRAVWEDPAIGALTTLRRGALIVESSTLTPAWVAQLAERARTLGAELLDAPVVGSRPQAEAGALIHLVGGSAHSVERARPVLAALGSALHHVGDTPAGAHTKLVVNALFATQVALLGELLGLARRAQLDVARSVEVLATLPVLGPAARAAASAMLAGRFEPQFPVELVAKDLRYALHAGAAVASELPLVQRAAEVFERAAAQGFGEHNLTAIARLYR